MISCDMDNTIRVIHEMSNDVQSKIFDDLLNRISAGTEGNDWFVNRSSAIEILESDAKVVHHHHRPQFCNLIEGKNICTVHYDLNDTDRTTRIDKLIQVYEKMDHIICLNSNQSRTLTCYGVPESNISLIPHGYDEELFNDKFRKDVNEQYDLRYNANDKIVLGINSRNYLRGVKGENLLGWLANRLSTSKVRFLLMGRDRELTRRHLELMGFEVDCYKPGDDYSDLVDFYKQIDVLLVLSWFEGGPACVPEAIASNVPVVSRDVGMCSDLKGVVDVFEDEMKMFLYLSKIADDREVLREIRSKRECSYKEILTWENVRDLHTELYNRV